MAFPWAVAAVLAEFPAGAFDGAAVAAAFPLAGAGEAAPAAGAAAAEGLDVPPRLAR